MSPVSRYLIVAVKAFCATVTVVTVLIAFNTIVPQIETRYFPVVSKLRMLSIHPEPGDPGQTRIMAEFRKLRNCEWVGISWFVGDQEKGFGRVPLILLRSEGDTGDPNRPLGLQQAGPWIIGAPMQDVLKNSFAQLVHRCFPFRITITEFWP